jgi:hypothetical protein
LVNWQTLITRDISDSEFLIHSTWENMWVCVPCYISIPYQLQDEHHCYVLYPSCPSLTGITLCAKTLQNWIQTNNANQNF